MGAGGGATVGAGSPPRKPGQRGHKVGLVWREGVKPTVVAGAGDVSLFATDGTRLAGSLDGRAALWPSATAAPIDLAPEGLPASEVQEFDGELQIGIAWKGMCARAGLWRGTAASFRDLTPKGFASGRAYGGTRGFQVGFVRAKDTRQRIDGQRQPRRVVARGSGPRVRPQRVVAGEKVQRVGRVGDRIAWRCGVRLRRGEPVRGT